jgi:hypothetical protein
MGGYYIIYGRVNGHEMDEVEDIKSQAPAGLGVEQCDTARYDGTFCFLRGHAVLQLLIKECTTGWGGNVRQRAESLESLGVNYSKIIP